MAQVPFHRALMRRLARHVGLRVFRIFARDLDCARPQAHGRLQLRPLDCEEVLALCCEAELELNPDRTRAALGRGDACAGAFERGRLVGYCWFAYDPLPHLDEAWVDFQSDAVWLYKSFVRPSDRGRGVARSLYSTMDGAARARGRREALICVESHNGPSVAAARGAGFEAVGFASYLCRKSKISTWSTQGVRQRAVRFYLPPK